MDSRSSLEMYLQKIVESPSHATMTRASIELMHEVCRLHQQTKKDKLFSDVDKFFTELLKKTEKQTTSTPGKKKRTSRLRVSKEQSDWEDLEEVTKMIEVITPSKDVAPTEMICITNPVKDVVKVEPGPVQLGDTAEDIVIQKMFGGTDEVPAETQSKTSKAKKISKSKDSPKEKLLKSLGKWNEKAEPWTKINLDNEIENEEEQISDLVKTLSATRSNIASAISLNVASKDEMKRFEKYWRRWCSELQSLGYDVFPDQFGRVSQPAGRVIHSCRPRISQVENVVISPGVKKGGQVLLSPVSLCTHPVNEAFPEDHPHKNFASCWRGILGEMELLMYHMELQSSVYCAIEAVNKNKIEPYELCDKSLIKEFERRIDALKKVLADDDNIYRIATNYWRIEECFWAIFHHDERRTGYSFFDRLRRRVQGWRTTMRKEHNIYVKDFVAEKDTLASINKYIGNIIFQSKKGISPGTVLQQLRPGLVVKVKNTSRLLKGRVIST